MQFVCIEKQGEKYTGLEKKINNINMSREKEIKNSICK